jgi:hypothetical protein
MEEQRPLLGSIVNWAGLETWSESLYSQLQRRGVHCARGALLSQLEPKEKEIIAIIAEMYGRWDLDIEEGLRRIQRVGGISSLVDPRDLAAALLAGIQDGVLVMLATGSARRLRAALDVGLNALRV